MSSIPGEGNQNCLVSCVGHAGTAHLEAGDDGEAAHKLGDEAVLDQVGLLHLAQDI